MSKLVWGAAGKRFYETGTDRGVLYVAGEVGVPWNGLISVTESPTGGEPQPYYADGFKYANIATSEEFEATIEAFNAPPEFAKCEGLGTIHTGLFIGQQPRKPFSMVYRTRVGNDLSPEYGYKLHFIYNALAGPSERVNTTLNDSPEAMTKSWEVSTTPPNIAGYKPSAHLIVDSRLSDPLMLGYLEGVLYGAEGMDPRMPTATEVISLFSWQASGITAPIYLVGQAATDSEFVENLNTNPSFETPYGTVEVWRNKVLNPSFEKPSVTTPLELRRNHATNPKMAFSPTTMEILTNHAKNPGFRATSGTTDIRRNLFQNPSVRVDTAHWASRWWGNSGGNGVTERFSEGGFGGTGYIRKRWTAAGDAADNGINLASTSFMPVTAGKPYSASVYTRTSRATGVASFRAWVDWRDSAGNLISEGPTGSIGTVPGNNIWTKFEVKNAVPPAGATHAAVYFSNRGAVTSWVVGDTFDFSAMLMEQNVATGPYFDGSSTVINHALGRPITYGVSGNLVSSQVTDGDTDTNRYLNGGTTLTSLTVDLGEVRRIDQVAVWHYYADNRTYYQTKTEVSEDGVSWTTIFDSAVSGTYAESATGKITTFSARPVRYVRDWSNGSTSNNGNHWVEVQARETVPLETFVWAGTVNNSESIHRAPYSVDSAKRAGAWAYQSQSGSGKKRIAVVADGLHNDTAVAIGGDNGTMYPGLVAGKTYTISATVTTPVALTGTLSDRARRLCFFYKTTGTNYTYVYGNAGPTTGSGRSSITVTLPSDVTEGFFRLYNGSGVYGETVYWEDLLITEGPTLEPYFDGSTPAAGDFTYAWRSGADQSPSVKNARSVGQWGGVRATMYQSTDRPRNGSYIGRARVIDTLDGENAQRMQHVAYITGGKTYTYQAYVRRNAGGLMNYHIQWYDSAGAVVGNTIGANTTDATNWVKIRLVAQAPANANRGTLWVGLGTGAKAYAETFDVDSVVITEGYYYDEYGDYFDGSTPASGDYTFKWAGFANESETIIEVPRLDDSIGQSGVNRIYQSSQWASTGTKSVCIHPIHADTNTWVALHGDNGNMRIGMQAGKTYTAIAKFRLSAPQTGTLNTYARRIAVFRENWSSVGSSAAVPNTAGVHEARVTFTVPSDVTSVFIRLYNGASAGNGDMWVDDYLLVEGEYTGPYFDGSTPAADDLTYSWASGSNGSESIATGINFNTAWRNSSHERSAMYQGSIGAISGTKVARILLKGSFASGVITAASSRPVATPGVSYTAFGSVRQDSGSLSGRYAQTYLYFYDVNGALLQTVGGDKEYMDGTYREPKVTAPAPTGATHVGAAVNVYAGQAGDMFSLDSFLITNDDYSTDSPYFDGATTDIIVYRRQQVFPQWEATAHASVSEFSFYPALDREARPNDAMLVGNEMWIYNELGYWKYHSDVPGLTV